MELRLRARGDGDLVGVAGVWSGIVAKKPGFSDDDTVSFRTGAEEAIKGDAVALPAPLLLRAGAAETEHVMTDGPSAVFLGTLR